MTASQNRDQQLLHYLVLPNHNLADLCANSVTGIDQHGGALFVTYLILWPCVMHNPNL
ncbi:MAG: hypothetical protein ABIP48_05255 [Planctomycetota bacterium]